MSLNDNPITGRSSGRTALMLPATIGFYLAFRVFVPLLSVRVFGNQIQDGAEFNLALNFIFFALAAFSGLGGGASYLPRRAMKLASIRWIFFYLFFSAASLLWSSTASAAAAVIYWLAMAADLAMVILLLRSAPLAQAAESIMKGYVCGACVVAAIAWILPAQSDLRLGDEELLGPNQIGFLCAFAFFFAQYLLRRKQGYWQPAALLLSITLIRTLSKTTIVAFLISQTYLLLQDKSLSRRAKMFYICMGLFVILAFSSLFASYYEIYSNAGNQSETLTGRFGIWAYIFAEAIDKPWFGHGFHSVWKVIPPFGSDQFEARHAHNEILQQFYTYGAVGLCMFLGIYGSIYSYLRRLMPSSSKAFFMAFLIFALIRGLADTEPFDLTLPLWTILLVSLLAEEVRTRDERLIRLWRVQLAEIELTSAS
jgi:exopolysaccharide production protein ExoQ